MLRFGIIGCGHIAQRHAMHISNAERAKLVAVCDIKEERALQLGNQYHCTYYSSQDAFFEHDMDVICVCTPNYLHKSHSIAAMEAGKHTLVEKPLALSTGDCGEMIVVSEKTGKHLSVVKQNRFNPPVQAVKELISTKRLGEPYLIAINCYWNRNKEYYLQSDWKGNLEKDGGPLFTQFSHFIDILYYLFGDIRQINGVADNLTHQGICSFEDTGIVYFKLMDSNTLGVMTFTTSAYKRNMEGSITIIGEHGSVKIGGQYLNTIDYQEIASGQLPNDLPRSNPANDYGSYQGSMSNHDKVIQNLIDHLEGKSSEITTPEDGRATVDIIERMQASFRC